MQWVVLLRDTSPEANGKPYWPFVDLELASS